MKVYLPLALMLLVLVGCRKESTMFHSIEPSYSGITFSNALAESDTFNALRFEYIYNGGGVGVADFNNDGLPDIFFSGNMVSSALYLNKGNFEFTDITKDAGVSTSVWCTGVSVVDINQDGNMDIYVSTIHPDFNKKTPNILFLNEGINEKGIPVFKDIAPDIGLADSSYSTQSVFLDYDRDGDLDMYLLTNSLEKYPRNNPIGARNDGTGKSVDKLFRQEKKPDGSIYFTDVSKEAGITFEGWGLGVIVNDFNNDGWPDVYCANDFLSSDHLYINQQNGTFKNAISDYMNHEEFNGMGVDMGDLNNDGFNDLVVTDMMPDDNLRQKTMFSGIGYDRFMNSIHMKYEPQFVRNVLQINNQNQTFSDIGYLSGIYSTDWSWSTLLADYDNDGLRDVFIANGYPKDITNLDFVSYNKENNMFGTDSVRKMNMAKSVQNLDGVFKPNFLFQNLGDYQFVNRSTDWGLSEPSYSNGAAYADFDLDGDLDLVINNLNREALLYQNNIKKTEARDKNYVQIKLKGASGNLNGLGAKIWLYANNQTWYAEHQTVRGYLSSVEPIEHFGIGKTEKLDSIGILWASGKYQIMKEPEINKLLEFFEKDAEPKPASAKSTTFFSSSKVKNYKHEEDDFIDFKYGQRTLAHKFSQQGPGIAVGDLNGDGLDDMVIGGSANQSTTLLIQNNKSEFSISALPRKTFEDTGLLLFDADRDGDLDLYCVSGSSEFGRDLTMYQDRLYLNDGRANFTLALNALPKIETSGGSVIASDVDHDGDLDLFIGGKIEPLQYPKAPRSFLLINNGKGNFDDRTELWCNDLMQPGMINSSIFSDYNNDGWVDLVMVGEFMPITIFKNTDGKGFEKITEFNSGWWNSITGGDFDNDGDVDYIAGNLGENSIFKASSQEPVSVYFKDFDKNGSLDPFLTRYLEGKEYMVHPRETMTEQVVMLRKTLKSYSDFGNLEAPALLDKLGREGVSVLKATWMSSAYIENKGNDTFEVLRLPTPFQFAPIFGVTPCDINDDEFLDFIAVGNSLAEETLYGHYDAGIGLCALGNGNGTFRLMSPSESGLLIRSDAKALVEVIVGKKRHWAASSNRDSLNIFSLKKSKELSTANRIPYQSQAAIVKFKSGKTRRVEFYLGSGYLSQSTAQFFAPALSEQTTFIGGGKK